MEAGLRTDLMDIETNPTLLCNATDFEQMTINHIGKTNHLNITDSINNGCKTII